MVAFQASHATDFAKILAGGRSLQISGDTAKFMKTATRDIMAAGMGMTALHQTNKHGASAQQMPRGTN